MATISARIKWATNLDELRRELKSGTDQVVVLEAAAQRTVRTLGGEGLMRSAHNAAAAIAELGGVSKLTAGEQEKVHNLLDRAITKYEALGQTAPTALREVWLQTKRLGDETGKLDGPISKAAGAFGKLNGLLGGLGVGLSVAGIVSFGKHVFDVASEIHDMAEQLGISVEAVQGFKFAASQAGSSLDDVGRALQKMNQNLGAGDKSTVGALREAGLSFAQIRDMKPEDAFLAITDAIQKIPDPMTQARVTMELFGKSGAALLPAIKEGFRGAADGAAKMSADTINALEAAQDAWGRLADWVVIQSGTIIAHAQSMASAITKNTNSFVRFVDNAIKYGTAVALSMADVEAQAEAAVKREAGETAKAAAVHHTAATETDKHAEAIKRLLDQLTGADKIQQAKDVLEALTLAEQRGIPIAKMTADQQEAIYKAVTDAIAVYVAMGRVAPPAIRSVYIETVGLVNANQVVTGLAGAWNLLGKSISAVQDLKIPEIPVATPGLPKLPSSTIVPASALQPPKLPTSFWSSLFGDGKTFGKGLSQVISSAFMGGGDAIKSVGSFLGSSITGSLAKTLTSGAGVAIKGIFGGAINAILPGVGALMGPVLEKALGGLKKLFGMGGEGRKLVEDFAKSMGGFDALHQKLNALPTGVGEKLWKNLTQGVGRNNPAAAKAAIEAINKALERQNQILDLQSQKQQLEEEILQKTNAALEKYGLTWRDAGQAFQDAHLDQDANQLYEDMQLLQRAGVDNAVIFGRMRDNIRTYLADATKYASSVTDGFAKLLSEMIATGNATDDDYASMVAYVKQAMKAGIELPESMKAIIQKLIDMGLLTDQNGNKIDNLEDTGISFSQTTTQGFKSVVDKLEEISKKLSELVDGLVKVGDEAVRQGGRIRGAFEEIGKAMPRIPAPPSPPPSPPGPQPDPNITAHTGGLVTALGIQRFGAGGFVRAMSLAASLAAAAIRPAGLDSVHILAQPGEAILTERQQDIFARAMNVAAGTGQIGPWRAVTILEVDRRELGRAVVPVLPGQARRLGVKVQA